MDPFVTPTSKAKPKVHVSRLRRGVTIGVGTAAVIVAAALAFSTATEISHRTGGAGSAVGLTSPRPTSAPADPEPANSSAPGSTSSVEQKHYVSTDSYYRSIDQCPSATASGTQAPGPGGTATPSFSQPWSYTDEGTFIQFYTC